MRAVSALALALAATPVAADSASVPQIVAAAAGADVVILGEIHDNPTHHATQAAVLAAIGPSAVVFEHVSPARAALVTPQLAADAAALADALAWADTGWPDFAMFAPLFAVAAEGPVYGALVDRQAAQGAFADGAAAAFGADAARFGLDQPLPELEQLDREAEQLAAHCDALPEDILPAFVEAQRLRDAVLARTTLEALAAHGGPVAVITGNGHARADWGVPALIARAAPDLRVFTLGQFEGTPEIVVPYDLWTEAPAPDRPDPCAAFR